MRSATRSGEGKSPEYLAWLHSLACIICAALRTDQATKTEAAHLGPRGLSTKVEDRKAVPLCRRHHEALHKLGPKMFWTLFALDSEVLIETLNARYDRGERAA
jgi:hypothetical protein